LLASAGSWLSDSETGTGVVIWNAQTGTKLRTVLTEANGGAHSVAFSPDGKLMAISSLRFDADKANDAGTSAIISLAHVASGVVQWRRTFSGSAKPVAFYSGAVLVLSGGQSMRFLQLETGNTVAIINRAADPLRGGRWNDFTIVKRGHVWVIGGEDDERKGKVEIIDPDGPVADADSAPVKDGKH
jgi:WD40 repeat protein